VKLRILHKGLILLLIPAALQGFLLFQLFTSFQEMDRMSREEENVSEAIDTGSQIYALISRALKTAWRTGKAKPDNLDPDTFRTNVRALIAREEQLMNQDPNVLRVMAALEPLVDDSYRLLVEMKKKPTEASDLQRMMDLAPRAKSLGLQQELIEAAKSKEIESLRVKRAQTRASRARIEAKIFFAGIAEIFLTLGLLLYFLGDVTKRLKILMQNAASVPTGKPMELRVGGGDELAYLDEVLHNASRQLEHAAQHRKTMTEMLSHDLRAPLLSANVSLDLLLQPDAMSSRDDYDKRVKTIKRSLTRLTSFVEDLLAIDQLESGKLKLSLEAVELRGLVEETIENIAVLSQEKNLCLKNDVSAQQVIADKNRFHQVLVNLISNAIKFSPLGGSIVISSRAEPERVILSITDEGPGIPEAAREKLFQKFEQGDSANVPQGFGLGLYICKLVVERHGGQVGVESQPDKGSRFWFSLPLDEHDEV